MNSIQLLSFFFCVSFFNVRNTYQQAVNIDVNNSFLYVTREQIDRAIDVTNGVTVQSSLRLLGLSMTQLPTEFYNLDYPYPNCLLSGCQHDGVCVPMPITLIQVIMQTYEKAVSVKMSVEKRVRIKKALEIIPNHLCKCSRDFEGPSCEFPVNKCMLDGHCRNGGTCVVLDTGAHVYHPYHMTVPFVMSLTQHVAACECTQSYAGDLCQLTRTCKSDADCKNGGTCIVINNMSSGFASCTCADNYSGVFCEDFDGCNTRCKNGGKCIQRDDGKAECHCSFPYSGSRCKHINYCILADDTDMYCANGGSCSLDEKGRAVCTCTDGFTGNRCRIKIDSCAVSDPCNGKTCITDPSSETGFRCQCEFYETGPLCNKRLKCVYREMVQPNVRYCQNGGTCNQEDGRCNCVPGWTGQQCEYEACNVIMCRNGGLCVHPGSCSCPPPYVGDFCQYDSDVCNSRYEPCDLEGTERCNPRRRRLSDRRFAFCKCKQGYYGTRCENRRVIDIESCQETCMHGTCDINGTCLCNSKFWKGDHCEQVIDCSNEEENPCMEGRCEYNGSVSFCNCTAEDELFITFCNTAVKCSSDEHCKHGGVCDIEADECICASDYYGPRCQFTCNCSQNGVCNPVDEEHGIAYCVCNTDYVGESCQIYDGDGHYSNSKRVQFCKNCTDTGGTCINTLDFNSICVCPTNKIFSKEEGNVCVSIWLELAVQDELKYIQIRQSEVYEVNTDCVQSLQLGCTGYTSDTNACIRTNGLVGIFNETLLHHARIELVERIFYSDTVWNERGCTLEEDKEFMSFQNQNRDAFEEGEDECQFIYHSQTSILGTYCLINERSQVESQTNVMEATQTEFSTKTTETVLSQSDYQKLTHLITLFNDTSSTTTRLSIISTLHTPTQRHCYEHDDFDCRRKHAIYRPFMFHQDLMYYECYKAICLHQNDKVVDLYDQVGRVNYYMAEHLCQRWFGGSHELLNLHNDATMNVFNALYKIQHRYVWINLGQVGMHLYQKILCPRYDTVHDAVDMVNCIETHLPFYCSIVLQYS